MQEVRPKNIRSLLLTVLILSSFAFQVQAYYHPDEGRWISRDPINEPALELSRGGSEQREDEELLADAREYLQVAEGIDKTTGKNRAAKMREFVRRLEMDVALARSSGRDLSAEKHLYLAMFNVPVTHFDSVGLDARAIAIDICQWDGPLPFADMISLAIMACCVLSEPIGCYPCVPRELSTSYQVHIVPPKKPHWPHKGTHTHHFQMHQSPWPMCRCFWSRNYVLPTGGASPLPGEVPWTPPAGGGTY